MPGVDLTTQSGEGFNPSERGTWSFGTDKQAYKPILLDSNGTIALGDGILVPDTILSRLAAGVLGINGSAVQSAANVAAAVGVETTRATTAEGGLQTQISANTLVQLLLLARQGYVATSETDTVDVTPTFGDLATPGPSVTVTSTGALALIYIQAQVHDAAVGQSALAGVNISGATTIGPNTGVGNGLLLNNANPGFNMTSCLHLQAITAGTNTYKMQYTNGGATQTATFSNRKILVIAP